MLHMYCIQKQIFQNTLRVGGIATIFGVKMNRKRKKMFGYSDFHGIFLGTSISFFSIPISHFKYMLHFNHFNVLSVFPDAIWNRIQQIHICKIFRHSSHSEQPSICGSVGTDENFMFSYCKIDSCCLTVRRRHNITTKLAANAICDNL